MKIFILLPNRDNNRVVEDYLNRHKVDIPLENIITVDEIEELPALIFFVRYDSLNHKMLAISHQNKIRGGYNVSLGGMRDRTIDRLLLSADREAIQEIIDSLSRGVRILTFHSNRGSGKTTLALNTAYLLNKKTPGSRILLLDLAFGLNDISSFFTFNIGLGELYSDYLLYSTVESIDRYILKAAVTVGGDSFGVDVLPSLKRDIKPLRDLNFIERSLSLLSMKYDYIVIDLSSYMSEVNEYLFRSSTVVVRESVVREWSYLIEMLGEEKKVFLNHSNVFNVEIFAKYIEYISNIIEELKQTKIKSHLNSRCVLMKSDKHNFY